MAGKTGFSGAFMPATDLEPGDRFETLPGRLPTERAWPALLNGLEPPLQSLEDDQGRPLQASFSADRTSLAVPDLPRLLDPGIQAVWLEYLGPGRFRLSVEKGELVGTTAGSTTDKGVDIAFAPEDWDIVTGKAGSSSATAVFDLALVAAKLATQAGFDQLLSLPLVRDMELLEHQLRTAKTVLRRLRGRALLCDEVGLGKTIEAGLVLSELHLRGLARSVLILVPPSLIEQWQGELRRKFGLEFVSHDDPAFKAAGPEAWKGVDRVIASTHTAKREPHRSAILDRKWDMVIVDEAHHLRNRTTQLWRFASEIRKQYILLLTATPVQNNLEELFNLVTLLEPGLLSTAKQFQKQFVDRKDKLTPKNVDELHALLREVMVRNRRSTVGLQFTRRWAKTFRLSLLPEERLLYEEVADFVRRHLREGKGGLNRMALLALQMALGSSSHAAARTLETLAENEKLAAKDRTALTQFARQAMQPHESVKVQRLLQLAEEFEDKIVIFTQFRATQAMLAERLRDHGHEVAVFHGGLSRLEKEAAVERFRGPARLLLATEAGSEGRNLQFAHAVCNYDLPWNPMKIEQRIGRLSRIGQTHDVQVFNFVAADTVEAAVLHLLEAKLNLFELVIGEIDMILGNLDDEREFPDVVADLWAESTGPDDFTKRMEDLGNRLLAAKKAYFEQRGLEEKLFADRFAPES